MQPQNMKCPEEKHQFISSWAAVGESYWVVNDNYFGVFPERMKSLILGTFPIPEDSTAGFFYHSDSNSFWKILGCITGETFSSLGEKLDWLNSNRIGITDVIRTCKRLDKECKSKSDSDLFVVEYNGVSDIINHYTDLSSIYFTSGGPKSKSTYGNSAGGLFWKSIPNSIQKEKLHDFSSTSVVSINKRILSLNFLFTPAPQNRQLSKYLKRNKQLLEVLSNVEFLDNKGLTVFEKYKCIQWACNFDLADVDVVQEQLLIEIDSLGAHTLLQENS